MFVKLAIFLVFLIFQASLPSQAESIDEILSPSQLNDGWSTGNAIKAGFEQEKISTLATALQSDDYLNVHAVLIEHKGKLVYEQYLTGEDQNWGTPIGEVRYDGSQVHDLRSISKSVTGLLLGIALGDDFETKLNRPLHKYLAKYKNTFGHHRCRLWRATPVYRN